VRDGYAIDLRRLRFGGRRRPSSRVLAASAAWRFSKSAIDSSGRSSSASSSALIDGIAFSNSSSLMIGATSGSVTPGGGGDGAAIGSAGGFDCRHDLGRFDLLRVRGARPGKAKNRGRADQQRPNPRGSAPMNLQEKSDFIICGHR
jgi:hypothetical protein